MLRFKTWHCHTKLLCQKPKFPSNYFNFLKNSLSIKASYKELTWCTNYPTIHIHTFHRRLSFSWGCFSPVSILKVFHIYIRSGIGQILTTLLQITFNSKLILFLFLNNLFLPVAEITLKLLPNFNSAWKNIYIPLKQIAFITIKKREMIVKTTLGSGSYDHSHPPPPLPSKRSRSCFPLWI